MARARAQAQRLNHEYIGTEHLLLGLVQEGAGEVARILSALEIDLNRVQQEIESDITVGPTPVTMGQLPFTPGAVRVLDLAIEEAANCFHNYVGTGHLLLGLILESEGKAAKVLAKLNAKADAVRKDLMKRDGGPRF